MVFVGIAILKKKKLKKLILKWLFWQEGYSSPLDLLKSEEDGGERGKASCGLKPSGE